MKPQIHKSENSFFEQVYEVCRLIPFGKVTTYGAIARYLGSAQSARMVGWALNSSFSAAQKEYIPAHRVVNRLGMLSGAVHFGGPNIMADLLRSEGIQVENNRITHFEQHFWDPTTEL